MAPLPVDTRSSIRASIISSNIGFVNVDGKYVGLESPADIEGGALRTGGAPNLLTKDTIGLLLNYAAIGIIFGAFPSTVYPFLVNYLQLDGYQAEAASSLVMIAWSFKTFIGVITDSFPICGYRRRPYMVLGWTMCSVFLLIMALTPVQDPFFNDAADRRKQVVSLDDFASGLAPANFTRNESHVSHLFTNPLAPASGTKYILMMMFASIGYVVADVAADAVLVEFAQREPENIRGTTQSTVYATRSVVKAGASALVGFGMNGKEYGGSFDFSLQYNYVMLILLIPSIIVIPCSWFLLKEEKAPRESFSGRCNQMWQIVQQRAIWQVMGYNFFSSIFSGFSTTTNHPIQSLWAKVEPLNENISSIISHLLVASTLFAMKKYGLSWNWRRTIAYTVVFIVAVDIFVMGLTIFDIFRNQWFYLGVPLVTTLPIAINFVVQSYITVELCDPGYEAATFGLLTTINNLAYPFSTSITKQVNAEFDVYRDDIQLDTPHVREHVFLVHVLSWCSKLFSLVFLVFLPRQKKETQELKLHGGKSKPIGALALLLASFALTWGVVTNLMSIFPSTACLKIAGGRGC